MIWLRRGFIQFLSLLLLVTLLGTALSTSANYTLGKPKKVEDMLAQSKLYDHFVTYTADQAKKTEGDNDQTGSVSLSDAAVLAAAKSAFPAQLIQKSVNTFLESNYAWLEGKTATPSFNIDLSSQKQTFAQKVGDYVKTYSATLPVCTPAQAVQEQGVDPLAATCRPAELSPDTIGAQVTQRLGTTGDFLSNPIITAQSVNPKGNTQSQPYYSKLSHLPKLYQFGQKLPYIFAVLSVLTAVGVVFASFSRRKGLRRVGIILLIAGIVLVLAKFSGDFVFKRIENHAFNSSSVGQLQQSLTDFAHRVESSMVKIDVWFGVLYLLLALVILGVMLKTRQPGENTAAAGDSEADTAAGTENSDGNRLPLILSRKRLQKRSPTDSIMPLGAKPGGKPEPPAPAKKPETPEEEAPSKHRKPPRLIQ